MGNDFYDEKLSKRREYEIQRAALMQERNSYEQHWRELAEFIKPERARFLIADKQQSGGKKRSKIIDSSGSMAARTLESGMHAGITSPARPWMRLTTPDPELAEYGPVKEWLNIVTQRMLTVFLKSNLYNALPKVYGDEGTFAVGAMGVLEDTRDVLRCFTYPIGSYALGVNERGVCDQFVREYPLTVRQIVKEFGVIPGTRQIDWTNISDTVRHLWDRSRYEQTVEVCWVIAPNEDHDASKLYAKYLPYGSCHFEKGSTEEKFLRESGFREFPVLAPRWEVTSAEDIYGTNCPGMIALGDIKQLQLGEKRSMQGVDKMVNPPIQAPTSLKNGMVSTLPSSITYVDVTQGQEGVKSIYDVQLGIDKLEQKQGQVRYRISRAYFEDLFLMLATSQDQDTQRTAREIEERHEEKLLALGPVLEQQNDELLDPLVNRTYAMMERAGMIPDPPDELDGVDLKVEYISVMAQAQKLIGVAGHERFITGIVNIAEALPHARHKVNAMQWVDRYGDMLGVDPKVIVPDDQAREAAQAEADAVRQQQQMEQAAVMTRGAKDLSGASLEGDTALSRIAQGLRG